MIPFHFTVAARGFGLGASLIVAIGAQNAFVLRQGLRRAAPLLTALTCALCDAMLIAAGIAGAGALVASHPAFARWAAGFGAVFLAGYGLRALHAAMHPGHLDVDASDGIRAWPKVIATTLGFSLLNPHVYLDTVLLLGTVGGHYALVDDRWNFGLGATVASFSWFFSLAFGAAWLAPLFTRPQAWRALDALVGVTMGTLAFSLARGAMGAL